MIYYWIAMCITWLIFGYVAIDENEFEPWWATVLAVLLCGLVWPAAWTAVLFLTWRDREEETGA